MSGLGGCVLVPLTERVNFKTRLQRGNRLQVSKYVRWRYKLEPDQYLKATVSVLGVWSCSETFLTRTTKDERIVIPKLIMSLLQDRKPNLEGYIVDVTVEPM